jgi:4-amino-4-deoxy-L-arabinose transferase-like glycosyltransferase
MRMRRRRGDPGLALILGVFVVLSALYHIATPPLEPPDEAGHVASILYLKQHHRLPVAGRTPGALLVHQELVQPPLYYALGALTTAAIDTSDAPKLFVRRPHAPIGRADIEGPKHAWMPPDDGSSPLRGTRLAITLLRMLSMLMGLATVVFTFHIARAVDANDVGTARFAAALVAFNPMFVFIANAVNNDNLVVMLVTLCVLLLLRDRDRPLEVRPWAHLGLLTGAAVLAKVSALILLPALALGVRKRPGTHGLAAVLASGAAALGVCGWWLLRNRHLYGDWLGLSAFTALAGDARPHIRPLALADEWSGFVKSYWGVFGAFNVVYPEPVYWLFYLVTAIGIAGVACLVVRRGRALAGGLSMLLLLSATNLVAVAYWTSQVWGSQGRLMFPSIASTSVLFAVGLGVLGQRTRDRAAVLISCFLLACAVYGAAVLIPSQYR